jgi:hypothetical protein
MRISSDAEIDALSIRLFGTGKIDGGEKGGHPRLPHGQEKGMRLASDSEQG